MQHAKTQSALNKALMHFKINKEQYQVISLPDLPTQVNQIFGIFPKKETGRTSR